jgi:hypothetical protein
LRKLTKKSIINFGKYKGQTVEEILRLGKRSYLRYLYYNLEGITFIDEILDEIAIYEDRRIPKPGKNPEYGTEIENLIFDKYASPLSKYHYKSQAKAQDVHNKIVDGMKFGRGRLARQNQGHR